MDENSATIEIIGLVQKFHPPVPASPKTRDKVPSGYGTREQCRPFVAAAGIGLTVPSPFSWGYCTPAEVPPLARSFQSPVKGGCPDRVFYILDDPEYGFVGNQFAVPDKISQIAGHLVIPGLSFFDREDQQTLVKVHLPYIFRTAGDAGLLFVPPINRKYSSGLTMMSGLVETGWYSDAVNLAFELPVSPGSVHVAAGDPLAQVLPVPMSAATTDAKILEPHRRQVRDTLESMVKWKQQHDLDRSAYKRISKLQITDQKVEEPVG